MNAPLRKRTKRIRWAAALAALGVAGGLALAAAGYAPAAPSAKGRFVKAGGHRLYLRCEGKGSPVVMLEAGLGDWSRGYNPVLARAKKIGTTVCAYDRYGLGRSGRDGDTRTVAKVVSDLHALVRNAKLRAPFVLGGGSMGGMIVRYYSLLYPKEVAGMVLFDSVPDDWDQYTRMTTFTGGEESIEIAAAAARLRASDRLGKKPLAVLQAGDDSYLRSATGQANFLDYWHPAQLALARISSNSIFAVATGSPHWVQSGAPDLSAEAIRLVVSSARSKKALPACEKSKLPRLGGACEETAG